VPIDYDKTYIMMKQAIHLSVVSPVYQAENIVKELVTEIIQNASKITENFEIILVNDASSDKSWEKITEESAKEPRVKGINLSRNFGQHNAITAGLHYAQGDWIVVMDCDLQDRPDEIPNLYNKAQEGYDSVFAQRSKRQDTFFKRFFSSLFYALFSYLTDTKQDSTVANFGIYRRCVIDAILSMHDQIRFFPTMVQWVGFRKFYLPVEHASRYDGKSSYNYKKLFQLALNGVISFSDKPLRLTVKIGFSIASLSFVIAIIYFALYFIGYIQVLGFTTIILSLWFLAGVIMLIFGVLGLYIGKMFEKVKQRPDFLVQEHCNL